MSDQANWEKFKPSQEDGVDDQYDKKHGSYKNNINTVPTEERLPQSQMPLAPAPSPFKLGPMSK